MTQQWKLVPVEPTDEQVKACSHDDHGGLVTAWYRRAIYAAMLAASPTPPASAQDDAKDERQAFEAQPYGWLYDWTHSSATGRPDEQYTGFTKDEAHAKKHDNPRAIYLSAPAAGDARDAAPWSDCKVAYGIEDDDALWSAWESGKLKLPKGWALNETDCSGARAVAIFRVDGVPKIADGLVVRAALAAQVPQQGEA